MLCDIIRLCCEDCVKEGGAGCLSPSSACVAVLWGGYITDRDICRVSYYIDLGSFLGLRSAPHSGQNFEVTGI